MKRPIRILIISIVFFLLFGLAGYFSLAYYYQGGYSLNTWINGVYCTGKTVEEINEELLSGWSKVEAPIVVVTDLEGRSYSLPLEEAGLQVDYRASLERFQREQDPFLWIDNVTLHREHRLDPELTYDRELLKNWWEGLDFVQQEEDREANLAINYEQGMGYVLYDGMTGRLDTDQAFEKLQEAVAEGTMEYALTEDLLYDIPYEEEQQKVYDRWTQIETFQQCDILYDMGAEQIPLTPDRMAGFLLLEGQTETADMAVREDAMDRGALPRVDSENRLMLDEAQVEAFVADLAQDYDTYQVERTFLSTRGDEVTIKGGTYGTKLDQKAEIAYLLEHLLLESSHDGSADAHIPTYEKETPVRGLNDIGDTYIEIDMTEQMLYYYEDGELMLETEVVTGNTSRRMGTPEGVNYIYNMQRNRILRGPGYASPVKYWMPINGGIGIHDANWRSTFGGTIYQKSGSHGCINVPKEIMPDLYEMAEIGLPVVSFY